MVVNQSIDIRYHMHTFRVDSIHASIPAMSMLQAWIWSGAAFMIGAIVVLNIAIILCLAYLECALPPTGSSKV